MATEGTPFRDRYASEARAAAARARAASGRTPTPVPRRVHAPSSPRAPGHRATRAFQITAALPRLGSDEDTGRPGPRRRR